MYFDKWKRINQLMFDFISFNLMLILYYLSSFNLVKTKNIDITY